MLHAARDVGAVQRGRLRPEAAARLSRRRQRAAAPVQELAADRAGDDELRLRPVGIAVPDRPRLHRVRARRRADPGHAHAPARQRGDGAGVGHPHHLAQDRGDGARACCTWSTLPGGTAPKAQAMGYSVGGKTGTAYKQEGSGYATNKYRAWFVGMAPIDAPAHHRRGDGRRADRRQVLRRRRRRAGVQRGRAADAAHDGRAARLDVKPQIVSRDMPAERRASDGRRRRRDGAPRLARGGARLAASCATRRRCVATAGSVGRATLSSPGRARATDGRRYVEAALPPAPTPASSKPKASRPSLSSASRASRRCAASRQPPATSRAASSTRRARQLDVVAVTGTNGKTSTAWWIAQALGARRPPRGRRRHARRSASRRAAIHRRCTRPASRRPTRSRCRPRCATSSCAASRPARSRRRRSASSSIGSPERASRSPCSPTSRQDHLDYHGDMRRVLAGEGAAVRLAGPARRGRQPRRRAGRRARGDARRRPASTCWTVSTRDASARLHAAASRYDDGGACASTCVEGDERVALRDAADRRTTTSPTCWASSARCARSACRSPTRSRACAALTPVPGRMERVAVDAAREALPEVVVDYAHTPDALEKALPRCARSRRQRGGKLWCVFGCGGNRDADQAPADGRDRRAASPTASSSPATTRAASRPT